MKRTLVIHYPLHLSREVVKDSFTEVERMIGAEFLIIPFRDNVEKIEVEILYDPHFKDGQAGVNQSVPMPFAPNESMEGSFARNFNRVNSSDKK